MQTDKPREEAFNDNQSEMKTMTELADHKYPTALKVDKSGLPLVPQPSDHPDDPLVRSHRSLMRNSYLLFSELAIMDEDLCCSITVGPEYYVRKYVFLHSIGLSDCRVSGSLANPAFVPMSKDLSITVQQASYTTTVFVLLTGVTPMALTPFANVYGRRNLYLVIAALHIYRKP